MLGAAASDNISTSQYSSALAGVVVDVGNVIVDAACPGDENSVDESGEDDDNDNKNEIVIETECGIDLSLPKVDDVSAKPPDGSRGWLIMTAAFVILSVEAVYQSLLELVLKSLQREYNITKGYEEFRNQTCKDYPAYEDVFPRDCFDPDLRENSLTRADVSQPVDGVKDLYDKIYSLFGILIVAFDYRLVTMIGASINFLSLLISVFVQNYKALKFLLAVCVGIGNNMLFVCGLVSIMEYFNHRRTLILILAYTSMALAIVGFLLMAMYLFPAVNLTSPAALLSYACISYFPCLVAGAFLTPLNLHMQKSGETLKGRVLRIEGLRILKSPLLYVLIGICLCFEYGQNVPFVRSAPLPGAWLQEFDIIILLAFKLLGCILASLFSCMCCCKVSKCCHCCHRKMSLASATMLLTVTLTLTGGVQLAATISPSILGIYIPTFGFFTGIIEPIMTDLVPLALGDKYLGVVMGLTNFGTGMGEILSEEISAVAVEITRNVRSPFYIGSIFLLMAAILSGALFKSNRHRRLPTDQPENKDTNEMYEMDDLVDKNVENVECVEE